MRDVHAYCIGVLFGCYYVHWVRSISASISPPVRVLETFRVAARKGVVVLSNADGVPGVEGEGGERGGSHEDEIVKLGVKAKLEIGAESLGDEVAVTLGKLLANEEHGGEKIETDGFGGE